MPLILTVDLGTTRFKFAIFDERGCVRASTCVAPPGCSRHPGWTEIDAEAFKETIAAALANLRGDAGTAWDDIAAVSFASQANSFLLLDSADRPLTPIILWTDARARGSESELQRISTAPDFARSTGVASLDFQFAAAKLIWLREHERDLWRTARRLCFVSDYLTHWLTGQHVTEGGIAGLSGGVDTRQLHWRDEFLSALEVPPAWLPRVVRAGSDIGTLAPKAATELLLPKTCRFIVGCLDQYAGAIGTGTVAPGRVTETTGTVLSAVRVAERYESNLPSGVFQGPAFDEGWFFQMCFSNTAGNLLEWYRRQLPGPPTLEALSAMAGEVPPDTPPPAVEPLDSGRIDDCFRNVSSQDTPGQIVRGIFERVALTLRDQVAALTGGTPPDQIASAGGGARSSVWLQVKADVLRLPFVASDSEEPTSLGAGMLAARALGLGSLPKLAETWVRKRAEHLPRRNHVTDSFAATGQAGVVNP